MASAAVSECDEWEWQSCGSGELPETDGGTAGLGRDKRVRYTTARVMVRVEKCLSALERTTDTLAAVQEETQRWRMLSFALLGVYLLQLLPASVRTAIAASVSKYGLRLLLIAASAHLLHATASKLLQRWQRSPALPVPAVPASAPALPEPPVAASAPALPSSPSSLPRELQRVVELHFDQGWTTVFSDPARGLSWESMEVDWNGGHKVTRFSALVKCSAEYFVRKIIEEAPAAQKSSDPLLETYEVLEDLGEAGRKIYMSFKTPVFGITARDMVTFIQRRKLLPSEAQALGFTDYNGPKSDGSASPAGDYGVMDVPMVLGTVSVQHPDRPENRRYVRGHINVQGYILLPVSASSCKLVEIIALDVKGTLPAWAVETGAKRVYQRFVKMIDFLEESFAKDNQ